MAEEAPKSEGLSAEEVTEVAFSGSAIYANRFSVSIGQGGVRISALEQNNPGEPLHFRAAIQTSVQEARALQILLARMLGGIEAKLEAAVAEEAAKKEATETTEKTDDG